MINPMQQAVIALRKRDSEAVITTLQNVGVLHLKAMDQNSPLGKSAINAAQTEDAQERREDERLLARIESTLSELDAVRGANVPLPAASEWSKVVEAAAAPVAALAKERQDFLADQEAERSYGAAVRALSRMAGGADKSKRVALLPFLLPLSDSTDELQANLKEVLPERYALSTEAVGSSQVGLLAVLKKDVDTARAALSKARVGELRLPGRFDRMSLGEVATEMEEISRRIDSTQRELVNRREQLNAEYAPRLFAIRDALKDRVALHDVRAVAAQGKYSMVLQGYLPVDRVPAFEQAMKHLGDSVSYELHDVDEHHDHHVPVELKNNTYVRPFQLVMGLLSPPKYGTFDPTWIIAIFMPFFFGMIMADMAFGLLFLAFGMWCLGQARANKGWYISLMGAYLPPAALSSLGYVTNVMALWTIVWGFLTGEFFGTLLEHFHIFYYDPVITERLWGWTGLLSEVDHAGRKLYGYIPILFPRLEIALFSYVALVFAICFGIFQVLWGWIIRIQQAVKHQDRMHLWEGIAMVGGVSGLVLLAFVTKAAKEFGNVTDFSNPLVIPMWIGFAIFVLGYVQVISKYPLLPVEMISQGGAVVSYSRLFAVGLVSAVLAKLCTDVGWSMYQSMGIWGGILGLLIGAVLHFLVLTLTLIGHILQPIRLHMLEFLNPTGFNTEASPHYRPLRRLSSVSEQVK